MFRTLASLLLIWLTVVFGAMALAQTTPQSVTTAQLREAREAVVNSQTISEQNKTALLQSYDQSLAVLKEQQSLVEQNDALDQILASAPDRMVELRRLRENPPLARSRETFEALGLEAMETLQTEIERDLTSTQELFQSAQARLSRLLGSTQPINELLAERRIALENIALELAELPEPSTDPRILAQKYSLLARQSLYRIETLYNRKILSNEALLSNLARAERDYASQEIVRLEAESSILNELIQARRERLAQQGRDQADQLQQRALTISPEIEALAARNIAIRTELQSVLRTEQQIGNDLSAVSHQRQEISEDFKRVRQRVEIVGPNAAISNALRSRLAELPTVSEYRQTRIKRDEGIAEATHAQLQIDDELRLLAQQEAALAAGIKQRTEGLRPEERELVERNARAVVTAYRDSLNELQRTLSRYISLLATLDIAEQELVNVSREYASYIDQQLFWMPSASALNMFTWKSADWSPWLTNIDAWPRIGQEWIDHIKQHPVVTAIVVWLMLLLLIKRRNAGSQLEFYSNAAKRIRTDSIRLTFQALGVHIIQVLPVPAILFIASLVMQQFADPIAQSYALGMHSAALLIFSLGLLRLMAAENGVGANHFGWPQEICQVLRRELTWFIPFGAILGFMVAAYGSANPPATIQSIGSLCFVLLMLGWIYITVRLFGPRSDIRRVLCKDFPRSWASQLHFIWYPVILLVPATLALLSLTGYHYTAVQLEMRVQMTLWFLIGLFLLGELILRWLYTAARRLRLEEALRRREEARAQRAKEEDLEGLPDIITPQLAETNFESLSEQSKRLVHTGFIFAVVFGIWSIWIDLIPALGLIRASDGATTGVGVGLSGLMSVTAMDILAGVFIIVITVLAARNIPGILEITLLQRLPLDPGARYAFTALTQYGIAGVGLFTAFSTMGLQWDKLQWLIAALGVGLGFGLQEIVANFVSGIILLFERPIRVGDVVTIDGTTGVVTRIKIRATTITNYDRQELVVPNKEFITSRLINWTLSDKLNRILLPVGLSYDSDVDLAMSLMREAAEEIPDVLKEPAPIVTFESFGDNALMLFLRVYLDSLDNRLPVITSLHRSIFKKFKDAGLVIAYPQRDIHLDIKHPLEVLMTERPEPAGKPT